MARSQRRRDPAVDGHRRATTDVLVIGGGPAGCWAAISAAESGASVVLVDKGYCGTSGAAAASGHGIWYCPPDPELREEAMASREALGGWLADRSWSSRVLEESFHQVNRLGEWGYPFPKDKDFRRMSADGHLHHSRGVQGPAYMRIMRRKVVNARVAVWDHSPVLELLRTSDGEVVGAAGVHRQGDATWEVRAKAVIVATGGCTFLSGGLGCNVLTGDGYLVAAEAGADLSGMEFSSAYAIAPAFSSATKTAYYQWATFTYEDGTIVPGAGWHSRSAIAKALLEGPVYCVLDQADPADHQRLRRGQPNFFAAFDKAGIDPFTQRFPVTLRSEATLRGTGGLRLVTDDCQTVVPGLFAAGDAATREYICGGFTGGASHNGAWAISSGSFAGRGAAAYAAGRADVAAVRVVENEPAATLRGNGDRAATLTWQEATARVQGEATPYDKNYFRTGPQLERSLVELDQLWRELSTIESPADVRDAVHLREAAAMTATARWMYTSALARTETRGMHKRIEHPAADDGQERRLLVGGLTALWTRPDPVAPNTGKHLAAVG